MKNPLTILEGDALEKLRGLADGSVHCVITSPPYWGLRDYGVAGQIGLEETPEAYVAKMVEVFREVKRVLRDDGTCWCNLGDSYACSPTGSFNGGGFKDASAKTGGRDMSGVATSGNSDKLKMSGLKPKDLCGIPWRVAFALQADGWYLRSDIIWHKPNPMPESVTDRPTKSHEYLFLLSKSQRYFYDAEAIAEQSKNPEGFRYKGGYRDTIGTVDPSQRVNVGNSRLENGTVPHFASGFDSTRNRRSVWTIPSEPYSQAHFATYPTALVKPCILAGTSAKGCCPKCGTPWERVVETTKDFASGSGRSGNPINGKQNLGASRTNSTPDIRMGPVVSSQTTGWRPGCECGTSRMNLEDGPVKFGKAFDPISCTILDPFAGSGTTGAVALELGRHAVLVELNPAYVAMIRQRCAVTPGLQLA